MFNSLCAITQFSTNMTKHVKSPRKSGHTLYRMLRDEVDSWMFKHEDYDSVDDCIENGDYDEYNETRKSQNDLIIECKMPYVIHYDDDMDSLMSTFYENQENPWGAANIDDALTYHTNYEVWRDQLPKSYSGRVLARCCAIVEYIIRGGDGNSFELGYLINVNFSDSRAWWQMLRVMHYNGEHLGVSPLSDTQVQAYGIDDHINLYEENFHNTNNKIWLYHRACINIMNCVYKTFVHPIEIVVYR